MSEQQKKNIPSEDELANLSRDELVELGTGLDEVTLVHRTDPWPVKGTRAEKRAARAVSWWFLLATLSGLAFMGIYIWWPSEYKAPETHGADWYYLYTPMIGLTLGLTVVSVGVATVLYSKKFFTHEVAVQQRHIGGSEEVDRRTNGALFTDARLSTGIRRRGMIKGSGLAAMGVMGLGVGVFALGGLLKNPWKGRDKAELWTTGWAPEKGEKVYLRRDTGDPGQVSLVRPDDLDAGGFETVFPFRESERDDEHKLLKALRRSDNPVMLVRLRPGSKVIKRAGQEDFNYGDFYAYSKICTHVGCPTSLFEQQTGRLLCPCHQSQFDVFSYAKPIFGPATRSLPQLPITVDEEGYLIARGDFIEAVGPGFWERKS